MLILTSKTPWRRRPSGPVELDRSSPQASGLVLRARAESHDLVVSGAAPFARSGTGTLTSQILDDNGVSWRPVDAGSNGGYYVASSVLGMPATGYTLTAWINITDNVYAAGCVIKIGDISAGYGMGLGDGTYAGGGGAAINLIGLNENVAWLAPGAVVAGGGLHHIAMVGNVGGGGSLYVDGLLKGTHASTANAPVNEITLLGNNNFTDRHTRGYAAYDIRAYATPLSGSEIWAHYDPSSRWTLDQPIVRRVYFDIGAGGSPSTFIPQVIMVL